MQGVTAPDYVMLNTIKGLIRCEEERDGKEKWMGKKRRGDGCWNEKRNRLYRNRKVSVNGRKILLCSERKNAFCKIYDRVL